MEGVQEGLEQHMDKHVDNSGWKAGAGGSTQTMEGGQDWLSQAHGQWRVGGRG